MKSKIYGLVFLLSIITVTGLRAQVLPGNIWSSPQSGATEGRLRSDSDNFMRPDSYTGVNFKNWFGMASFLMNDNSQPFATIGFASSIKNVYIGAFYTGNMWTNRPVNNYFEGIPATPPAGGETGRIYNVYNTTPNLGGTGNPVNNAAVLIGVANMGFRLVYRTNYQSFNENNIVTGDQLYESYLMGRGYIAPQIAWAMAKDLTKNGIRPYASVDLVFNRDYQKTQTAGPDSEGNSGEKIDHSENNFAPVLGLGLGGFAFYDKKGFKGSFDFDYELALKFYNNEYSYVDNGVYKTGAIKGTYRLSSNPYNEYSYISNLFIPSVIGAWGNDRLALRVKLNLPFTFSVEEQNTMDLTSSGDLVYHGDSKSTSTFIFRPDLRLALQFHIVPGKLSLNTGARLQAPGMAMSTIEQITFNRGTEIGSQKIHDNSFSRNTNPGASNINTGFVSSFSIGIVWSITDNVFIDAATGINGAFGNNAIDIFAPGGLFSFGNILVGLKF